jgi:hypothetical protein
MPGDLSRGVYLAVPSLAILAMLLALRRKSVAADCRQGVGQRLSVGLAMAAMSYPVFRTGGYRALAATLGCLR